MNVLSKEWFNPTRTGLEEDENYNDDQNEANFVAVLKYSN